MKAIMALLRAGTKGWALVIVPEIALFSNNTG